MMRAWVSLCALALACQSPADARRHSHIADPKLDSGNVFASPDSDSDVAATFVLPGGRPLSATRAAQLPDFQLVRQLPSLTQEQRRQVDVLQRELNIRTTALREGVATLRSKLEAVKSHPHETVMVQDTTLPDAAALKARIADLNRQASDCKQASLSQLYAVLNDEQRKQYAQMRRGMLVIGTDKGDLAGHSLGSK